MIWLILKGYLVVEAFVFLALLAWILFIYGVDKGWWYQEIKTQ